MRKQSIDNYVNEKVGTPSTPYSEQDWNAMEAMLENDRRGFFFFLRKYAVVALLLVLVLGGGLVYTFTKKQNSDAKQIVVFHKKKTPVSTLEKENIQESKIIESIDNRITENLSSDKSIKTRADNVKLKVVNPYDAVLAANGSLDFKEVTVASTEDGAKRFILEESTSVIPTTAKKSDAPEVEDTLASSRTEFAHISAASIELMDIEYNIEEAAFSKLPRVTTPGFWKFSLSPYLQYAIISNSKLSAMHGVESVEKPLNTWGAGISFLADKGNLSFQTGLGYSSVQSLTNFSYSTYQTHYDTTYILQKRDFSTTQSGKDLALVKQVVNSTTDTTAKTICNDCITKIEYIDLPLSVQYLVGKRKLKVYGELGATVSIPISVSGYTIFSRLGTEVGLPERLDKSQVSTLLRAYVGLGARYSFNPKIGVYTQVGYRMGINPILKGNDIKPNDQLLKAGVILKL